MARPLMVGLCTVGRYMRGWLETHVSNILPGDRDQKKGVQESAPQCLLRFG